MLRIVRRLFLVALAAGSLLAVSAAAAPRKLHGNNFFSNCRFSHTAPDDPIVLPGQPGRSHPHTFFGNTTTSAASTVSTLLAGGTTCKPAADTAAYWVPTLFDHGREVRPAKAQLYYVLRGYDQMHAFPSGLRVVAGNARPPRVQSLSIVYWACGASGVTVRVSSRPPRCGLLDARFHGVAQLCRTCPKRSNFEVRVNTHLELHVNFPDCWDGKHLDSADHHSHMAYGRDYVCPASHPVKMPLIRLMIRYPLTDARGVALSSGGQLTGHADFFNTWDERALESLVEACFRDRPCNR
ncbi:MAG TPA: DUF1996 domain-containing protein [Gaiellaceae bacterium]|nr:DUF1996 domain-containing protein [Gaiellaceae bacterium]